MGAGTTKPVILAAWRREQAMALRLQGLDYRAIGARLHISHSTAQRAVKRTLKQLNDAALEDAAELVRLELARLDVLQGAIWSQAMDGDLQAVALAARIVDQRCKLLGLEDASAAPPPVITLRVDNSVWDAESELRLRKLQHSNEETYQ